MICWSEHDTHPISVSGLSTETEHVSPVKRLVASLLQDFLGIPDHVNNTIGLRYKMNFGWMQ